MAHSSPMPVHAWYQCYAYSDYRKEGEKNHKALVLTGKQLFNKYVGSFVLYHTEMGQLEMGQWPGEIRQLFGTAQLQVCGSIKEHCRLDLLLYERLQLLLEYQ